MIAREAAPAAHATNASRTKRDSESGKGARPDLRSLDGLKAQQEALAPPPFLVPRLGADDSAARELYGLAPRQPKELSLKSTEGKGDADSPTAKAAVNRTVVQAAPGSHDFAHITHTQGVDTKSTRTSRTSTTSTNRVALTGVDWDKVSGRLAHELELQAENSELAAARLEKQALEADKRRLKALEQLPSDADSKRKVLGNTALLKAQADGYRKRAAQLTTRAAMTRADVAKVRSGKLEGEAIHQLAAAHEIALDPALKTVTTGKKATTSTKLVTKKGLGVNRSQNVETGTVTEEGHTTHVRTGSNTVKVSKDGASAQMEGSDSTTTVKPDGTTVKSGEASALAVGYGPKGPNGSYTSSTSSSATKVDPQTGRIEQSKANSASTSVGLAEGEGFVQKDSSDETVEDGAKHTTKKALKGTVSKDKLGAEGSRSRVTQRDHLTTGTSVSADGHFSVKTKRLKDGRYELTTSIFFGVGGKLDASANSKSADVNGGLKSPEQLARGPQNSTVKGGVGLSGSAGYTQVNVFSAAEAKTYMLKLAETTGDKAGGAGGVFSVLAKARAAQSRKLGVQAVLGNAETAKQLGVGESYSLTMKTAGSLSVGASHNQGMQNPTAKALKDKVANVTVGLSASGEASYMRSLKVSRTKEGAAGKAVDIAVGFVRANSGKASGSFGTGHASMGLTGAKASSKGETFLFRVPESELDAVYSKLVGAMSPEAMRGLARSKAMAKYRNGAQFTASDSKSLGTKVNVGPVGATLSNSNSYSEEVNVGLNPTGKAMGGQTDAMAVNVGSLGASESTTVEGGGTVDKNGDVSLVSRETTTKTAPSLAGVPETLEPKAWLAYLKGIKGKSRKHLQQVAVKPKKVRQLVKRAGFAKHWASKMDHPFALEAWETLRRRIRRPSVPQKWAREIPAGATKAQRRKAMRALRNMARARAMARAHDDHKAVKKALYKVLNEWGNAEDIGSMTEFPPAMMAAGDNKTWEALEKAVPELAAKLAAEEAPDATTRREVFKRRRQLTLLKKRIQKASFKEPRAKAEMAEQVIQWQAKLQHPNAKGDDALMTQIETQEEVLVATRRAEADMIVAYRDGSKGTDLSPLYRLHDKWNSQVDQARELYKQAGLTEQEIATKLRHVSPDEQRIKDLSRQVRGKKIIGAVEWPASIKHRKTDYDVLLGRAHRLTPSIRKMDESQRMNRATVRLAEDVLTKVSDVRSSIRNATDFTRPDAKVVMLRTLTAAETELRHALTDQRYVQGELDGAEAAGEHKNTALIKRSTLELSLRAMKSEERRYFAKARAERDPFDRPAILEPLRESYGPWKAMLKDYRSVSVSLGMRRRQIDANVKRFSPDRDALVRIEGHGL